MDVLVIKEPNQLNRRPGKLMRNFLCPAMALCCLLWTPLSATSPDGGTDLSQAVPSDVTFYFHTQVPSFSTHEDSSQLEGVARPRQALAELREALARSSFITRYAAYLDEVLGATERLALEPELQHWRELLETKPWWKLVRNEFFLAGRVEAGQRVWLAGFRVTSSERDFFLASFRELLASFAAILFASELEIGQRRGVNVTCLYSLLDPSLEVCAAGHGDIVLLSTSRGFLRQSLQLFEDESSSVSFGLRRASGQNWPSDGSLEWLAARSKFLENQIRLRGPNGKSMAGFELMVKPQELFPRLVRDDPLLEDWKSLTAAGEFHKTGVRCYFYTDLPAGQEELERVIYRAVFQPIQDLDIGPILFREVRALVPKDPEELDSLEVKVLLRELARWLKNGLSALRSADYRLTSQTVTGPDGRKRLRGDVSFPLTFRETER